MDNNYLMLGDNRFNLSDELAEFLLRLSRMKTEPEEHKKDPFSRAKSGAKYYVVDMDGTAGGEVERFSDIDDDFYRIANYCTDKAIMEQRALHETLNRLLWRYSEQHGGDNVWDGHALHWYIYMTPSGNLRISSFTFSKIAGTVYFSDEKTAQAALVDIVTPFMWEHPDFQW